MWNQLILRATALTVYLCVMDDEFFSQLTQRDFSLKTSYIAFCPLFSFFPLLILFYFYHFHFAFFFQFFLSSDFIILFLFSLLQEMSNLVLTVVMDSLGHELLKPRVMLSISSSKLMKQSKKRDGNFVTMEIVSNLEVALWLVVPKSLHNVKSKQVDCCMDRYPENTPLPQQDLNLSVVARNASTSRNLSTGLVNADSLGVVHL